MPLHSSWPKRIEASLRPLLILLAASLFNAAPHSELLAQELSWLFPPRALMPELLAGPRDPMSSFTIMGVPDNPSLHGPGFEVEVSLGTTFPVFLLSGTPERNPVLVGIEAAAFARFGLQVLEREMVATDWVFAVPVIWHHERGWTRIRYYHSSSHIGDEYNRRFEEPGINSSRDALDLFVFRELSKAAGAWLGVRYGYNVHPQEDERWVLRGGGQLEAFPDLGRYLPFLAADIELDEEAGMRPRVELRLGTWLPKMGDRRTVRVSFVTLTGPSPLGQFRYESTTQVGLSLQGSF